ncbi:MAG: segregation/condensation protein A [Candidatus Marinimicrobia bacterium]|nr:segregation/condensation protein A [Candidatus Neomarinimicrobiota bacterium]MBL7059557.1 segregation/condensation protein A [Candidatus Neomarinimicrobiota bacterium]
MYSVKLENFEGPLDLLLYFIRRDEIDIYDIPIAKITAEYISILNISKTLNINNAGEFIVMAATLMRLKAKMMIPRPKHDDEDMIEDPRQELVEQLLQYRRFKDLAEELDKLSEVRSRFFPRGTEMKSSDSGEDTDVYLREVSLFDIAQYFKDAMERMPVIRDYELHRELINLEDQKAMVLAKMDGDGKLRLSTLFKIFKTKLELIVTFLAILELMRSTRVTVVQSQLFGEMELQMLAESG